jgi:hypothetical protein
MREVIRVVHDGGLNAMMVAADGLGPGDWAVVVLVTGLVAVSFILQASEWRRNRRGRTEDNAADDDRLGRNAA